MTNSTFYSFIALIEFTIFVLLINYHLNPQTLIPKCAIGNNSSMQQQHNQNLLERVTSSTVLFVTQSNTEICSNLKSTAKQKYSSQLHNSKQQILIFKILSIQPKLQSQIHSRITSCIPHLYLYKINASIINAKISLNSMT